MFVTLEVSKLSGWLNDAASCRDDRRAYMWAEVCGSAGGRGGGRRRRTQRAEKGSTADTGHGEERTENMAYMVVTLEVSKLSGWSNALAFCRESKEGHTCGVGYAGRQAREAAGDGGASSVQERARVQIRDGARGGSHLEHVGHGCDAGGVEAQRLVER